MAEQLAEDIRHHMRWVEDYRLRRLLVRMLERLEGPGGVPKIPHPDGSGDPANTTGVDGFNADNVIRWLEDRGVKPLPWQRQKLGRL